MSFQNRNSNSNRQRYLDRLLSLPSSKAILSTLGEGFERSLFVSALRNLSDVENPIRFNNFAYAMREVVINMLRQAAPVADVERCSWYTKKSGEVGKITRGEMVRYAIQGGLSKKTVAELLGTDEGENEVEELVSSFPKLFQKSLNEHTHIRRNTFDIGAERSEELACAVLESVHDILYLVNSCRHEINRHISGKIDDAVLTEFIGTVFPDLDLLYTHTTIEQVHVDEHSIIRIDANSVHIRGSGTVYVDLQYGSGSDMTSGIGAAAQDSFPFEFTCTADISNLGNVHVFERDILVDTSSFYE